VFVVVLVGGFGTRTEAQTYATTMKDRGHLTEFTITRKP
jgi:hypothetical protein